MSPKTVILNAAESSETFSGGLMNFFYKAVSKILNTKLAKAPVINIFETRGRKIYEEYNYNPDYFNTIKDDKQRIKEEKLYNDYLENLQNIANHIKNADNIVILGHSSKNMSDEILSSSGDKTSVEHIINILKKANELQNDKTKEFQVSLVACSGINIGRNLITLMQENQLYGRVTARNHTVIPDPLTGKKYNKPIVGNRQHQYGDYKRILIANENDCLEYKVNKKGKEDASTLQRFSPEENRMRYFRLEKAIAKLADVGSNATGKYEALFETYKPSEVFHYLYEYPYLFSINEEEKFKTLLLNEANKKYKDDSTPENAKQLLEVIRSYILYSTWKTRMGGVTVRNKDYGNQIEITHTMVKILDVIDGGFKKNADLKTTLDIA